MARAAFESVTSLPSGWRLTIDNAPQGSATLTLEANAGASPIDEETFRKIDLQTTEAIGDTRFEVWGWFTIRAGDAKPRRIPFSTYSFKFVERYPRRRINTP
jgi:hypothetical protein